MLTVLYNVIRCFTLSMKKPQTKRHIIAFELSEDSKKMLESTAKKCGISVGKLIRFIINEGYAVAAEKLTILSENN